MTSVLLFQIGPVQDFIAASRRGRDLWFSSWLLSDLARAALQAADGAEKVLPADAGGSTPHKLLLRTDWPAEVGQAMAEAVHARLAHHMTSLQREFGSVPVDWEVARQQVLDLVQTSWAAVPEHADDYAQARRKVEHLLAAQRSHRAFVPPTWAAAGSPKGTLDGLREVVVDLDGRPDRARRLGARPGERLDGPGLLKRLGYRTLPKHEPGSRLVSTGHLAAGSLLQELEGLAHVSAAREAFDVYRGALEGLDAEVTDVAERHEVLGFADAHVLYEGRLRDFVPEEGTPGARAALKRLFATWRELGLKRRTPGTYYAVLLADGDGMGKWLSDHPTVREHKEFARQLGSFAEDARKVVEEAGGHCVYAGGDDVLALLPLAGVLDAGRALADAFSAALPGATLSAGVVVAHHLEPFAQVLTEVRKAERRAKEVPNKGAWAVTLLKRSGAPITVAGRWEDLWLLQDPVSAWLDGEGLPRGLPHDLRSVADQLPLDQVTGAQRAAVRRIHRLEAQRVIAQKQLDLKETGLGTQLDHELPETGGGGGAGEGGLRRLADRLIVARALSGLEMDR